MTPLINPVSLPHQLQSPFLSFQIKIHSSQETQQSFLQEKLREHLAEKEKLNDDRLQQEEKLRARIKQLLEEKAVRRPLSSSLLLESDETAFSEDMYLEGEISTTPCSVLWTKLIKRMSNVGGINVKLEF